MRALLLCSFALLLVADAGTSNLIVADGVKPATRSEQAHKKGNGRLALKYMERIVEVDPNHFNAWMNIGSFYADIYEQADYAESAYLKALSIHPTSDMCLYNLAVFYHNRKENSKALDVCNRAIASNPRNREASNTRCSILRDLLHGDEDKDELTQCFKNNVSKFPDDAQAHNNYGSALSNYYGNEKKAVKSFKLALDIDPSFYIAWKNLGTSYKRLKKHKKALKAFEKAMSLQKKLVPSIVESMGEVYMELDMVKEREELYAKAMQAGVWRTKGQFPLVYVPELEARPWWPIEEFRWSKFLLDNYPTIREEGLNAMNDLENVFRNYSSRALGGGEWWDLTLWQNGVLNETACAHTPRTCAIMSQIPEATTCSKGNIYFSVMTAGSALKPHFGPTNVRLRSHLGIKIPNDAAIRVLDKWENWGEGKLFVFDDSFEHEVYNQNSKERRLVFIFDTWHPQLNTADAQWRAANWPKFQ